MKAKKILSVLLAMTLTVGIFGGCNSKTDQEEPKEDKKEEEVKEDSEENSQEAEDDTYENGMSKTEQYKLRIGWADLGNGDSQIKKAIELFTSRYPNVEVELTSTADYNNILNAKIGANDPDDMFDVFVRGDMDAAAMIEAGLLEPLEELWDAESTDTEGKTLRDLAQDYSIEFSYKDGTDGERHCYEFPTFAGGYFSMYYDKALFEEKGWNQNPQTWQEFLDMCAEIKADGVTPLVYTGVHDYLTSALMCAKTFELADEAGVYDEVEENYRNFTNDYYSNEYMVGFWEKLAELSELGYWHEGLGAMNHTQSQMQVIQGSCALVVSGSWIGNEMKDSTPEGFEWGFMTIPMRETTDTPLYVTGSTDQSLLLYSGSSDDVKVWGKEFIRCMWDMEVQIAGAECGTVSIRTDFAEDPDRLALLDSAMANGAKYVSDNDAILVCTTQLRTIDDAEYAQTVQYFNDSKVDMVLGNVDVKEVLDKCQEGLDAVNAK